MTARFIFIFAIGLLTTSTDGAQPMALFKAHCVKCHGQDGQVKGKVNLLELNSPKELAAKPELLETLVEVLEDRAMPPEDEPALKAADRTQVVARLREMLAAAAKEQAFLPTPMRRMNRFQYNNAVVDLLELDRDIFQMNERLMRQRSDYFKPAMKKMPNDVNVSSRPLSKDIDNQRPEGFRGVSAFPQDKRAEHGFDNRADHLTMSPLLMESFLKLSQDIAISPDINAKECKSWPWLFAAPGKEVPQGKAIRDRLKKLLRRAFRQPSEAAMVERFAKFAEKQIAAGATWESAMRQVVSAVLGMPDFLYIYESPNPGTKLAGRQRIDDYELATRLAQFFWSSIPDDTLLDLAAAGKLSDAKVLSKQIDRMMNDKKIGRFTDNFPAQWLQLDRLVTSIPDPKKFPYFYYDGYRTSMHMMSEPLLLFETILVEDRSIMDLIAPDFTWESTMLKANYAGHNRGGRGHQVQHFRRVPVTDLRRGGVITSAAVLTMTSTPSRTQPITRGTWINAVIFNDPPEPPPADVPPLDESNHAELEKLTIRERLAAHRKRADCAGCHNKIDPLGFALENFGPTGVWRDKYENGRDVDVSNVLFNQHKFADFNEFKKLIVKQKPRFTRGFIAHLLSYALCRELGPADTPALDAMTAQAISGKDNLRAVLKAIALSEPFHHKNTLTTKP